VTVKKCIFVIESFTKLKSSLKNTDSSSNETSKVCISESFIQTD